MREEFLHYVWRLRHFDPKQLATTSGEPVDIIHPGDYNLNSGPDFSNAKIKIGQTTWVGNVEIHVKSSDWLKHNHHRDRVYDSVILHVVLEEDTKIKTSSDRNIPTIELKRRIQPGFLKNYFRLQENKNWIPCSDLLEKVDPFIIENWLERCAIERLQQKTKDIKKIFLLNHRNWAATFFIFLAKGFGQKINAQPFEQLARSFPHKLIAKNKHSLLKLEALFLGQAGFLDQNFETDYPKKLKREYKLLQHAYGLQPLDRSVWRFSKLRPANFPTIRLAQLASLCFHTDHLFSKMIAAKSIGEIENMLTVKLQHYWQQHYILDKPSTFSQAKILGKTAINLLIINTIAPFTFFYGNYKKDDTLKEKAIHLLESLPPESNHIIRKWKNLGVIANNALQSQGLIGLKQSYCQPKLCFNCAIGDAILKK